MLDIVLRILLLGAGVIVAGWLALLLALGLIGLLSRLHGAARRWAVAAVVLLAAAAGWGLVGRLRHARAAPDPPPVSAARDGMR
jgi:hypothetical protein